MKNKGLIIGGVAVVALGAFLWMRKKNQMAEETSSEENKTNTSTLGTGTGTGTGTEARTKGGNAPIASTSTSSNVAVKELPMANIRNADDMEKTALGIELSIPLLSFSQKSSLNNAILSLPSGERKILNYITLVNATTRKSSDFTNALSAKLGSNAPSLIDSVVSKLVTASTASTQVADNSVQSCLQRAREAGIRPLQIGRLQEFMRNCTQGNSFNGSYSFNASGFENDCEDFAFNGHTF